MPTRRSILQSAAALSAAPLASRVLAGGVRPAAHLGALGDERHPEARAFIRRAAALDVPVLVTRDGDITELWQRSLGKTWKSTPLALAGLTERPALFLLEQLGWQHGMRVFFQAEHRQTDEGLPMHRLLRSSKPGLAGELDGASASWPAVLADQLLTAPLEVASRDMTPTGAAMANHDEEPDKLYSWIIAPKSAVKHI